MHHGARIARPSPAAPAPDRIALAIAAGALSPPPEGPVLAIRPGGPGLAAAIDPSRLTFEARFRPLHDALAAAGLRVVQSAAGPAAMAAVGLSRARAASLGDVARALGLVPPGGLVAIEGAKTDGIDAVARTVAAALPVEGAFAKAHGRAIWLRRPATLPEAVADWVAAAAPARTPQGFVTAPGVFSPEGPDPGSLRLVGALAGSLAASIAGRVADLGAGWGYLAHEALARCPRIEAIDLYEAEARALELARENVTDPRASFHWADATALARAAPGYDAVLTNPPFHAGRAADPALGAAFVAAAARILKPSGRLLMVANRQLPYEAALDAAFARRDRLAEGGGYKVILADRPRRR